MIMQFLFGLIGSFLGGVAFGPINLSVVDITLKKNFAAALRFCFAAALVEIGQATIAIMTEATLITVGAGLILGPRKATLIIARVSLVVRWLRCLGVTALTLVFLALSHELI